MKITEKVVVEKELHVASCIKCGHDDILISDNNYSSFNSGGGKCKKCGHEVTSGVGCMPTMSELVSIWNSSNDVNKLIKAQENIVNKAEKEITRLQEIKIQREKIVA